MSLARDVVIVGACRTPIGAFGGALRHRSAADLGALAVRQALARAGVSPDDLGDVLMGCVLQAGNGMNVARQVARLAGLPDQVPAETVNRVCGSGLQSVIHGVEALQTGWCSAVVAGGCESMTNAPYLLRGARWGYRMGHGEVTDSMLVDGLTCALEACHMGETAERVADRFVVTRDEQDDFAAESRRRAQAADAGGAFAAEIEPVEVPGSGRGESARVDRDEPVQRSSTREQLSRLKPVFRPNGTVTAGNASGLADGAAAVVLTTADHARVAGLQPMARVLSYAVHGVEPAVMGMGPVPAVRMALERAGLGADQVDLFELNEAFAAQSVAVVRALGLDPERVNVNGGAIALGHPIGASGARILTTLLYALKARRRRYGVASLCIGGGMGIAMAVEALL